MDKIEKIRQEIERRKKKNMYINLPMAIGRYYEDRDLLAFIDSLQQEQPSEDLENAAIDYADYARKRPKDYVISSVADYDHGCIDGFKAGAEWQKEQLLDDIKLAYGKVSMNPFDCSEAFEELISKIESI